MIMSNQISILSVFESFIQMQKYRDLFKYVVSIKTYFPLTYSFQQFVIETFWIACVEKPSGVLKFPYFQLSPTSVGTF